jgi:hypothetical protein
MHLEHHAAQLHVPGGAPRERERQYNSHQHHQNRMHSQLILIMTIGLLPDAVKPGFHCVRTHWIRGFIAFHRVRRTPERDADGVGAT